MRKPLIPKIPLRLFNTLTKQKEIFEPLSPSTKEVTMYNCGPTVYGFAHIGNLRSYVFADILKRTLMFNDYKVKQVINITDVGHLVSDADEGEDKMELTVKKEHRTAAEISQFYTEAFLKDLAELHIDTEDTLFPRATEYIDEQIRIIQSLEKKGFTYQTSDGVYFDTSKFPEYGKLGQINLSGLEEGHRIGVNKEKRNPTDFAVWKFSPAAGGSLAARESTHKDVKRDQEWDSPWGVGFPGWHIECSAMAMRLLGETIDIHTGGVDHIPVHHNNEIAQSESLTGKQYVRYWMHGAFLNIAGEKIAKSTGNTFYLKDVVEKGFSPLSYRYFLFSASYRTQLDFTWEALTAADTAYKKLIVHVSKLINTSNKPGGIVNAYETAFIEAINDDLNVPKALALAWDLLKDAKISNEDKIATLNEFDVVLGLNLLVEAEKVLEDEKIRAAESLPKEVEALAAERKTARDTKNFKKSDELRDKIAALGYEVKDGPEGQKVTKSR